MFDGISIKPVTVGEAGTLLNFSRTVFFDAFAHLNSPEDMHAYASVAFTLDKLTAELSDPGSTFYFAMIGDQVAGYIKLNNGIAQTEFKNEDGLEVERIYVHSTFQGKKIGNLLLDFAIDTAIKAKRPYIWLGVWEHNDGAIRFYERNGFVKFSSHQFMLGKDEQIDVLMKKVLG